MTIEQWLNTELGREIWKKKYQYKDETLDQWFDRVSGHDKEIRDLITNNQDIMEKKPEKMSKYDKELIMANLEDEMKEAARNLDFERAAELRDALFEMRSEK